MAIDHGYRRVMRGGKREYEHRLIVGERARGMVVHHINGDGTDNRPENLEPLTHSEHVRRHAKCYDTDGRKRCSVCGEYKSTSEYARGRNETLQGPCRQCKAAYNRRYASGRSRRKSSKQ